MKLVLTTMAGFSLAIAPAYAQTAPTPAATPAAQQKPERMICREDNEIGSLLKKKRICMTAAQWREQGHREGMDLERREAQRSGGGG